MISFILFLQGRITFRLNRHLLNCHKEFFKTGKIALRISARFFLKRTLMGFFKREIFNTYFPNQA